MEGLWGVSVNFGCLMPREKTRSLRKRPVVDVMVLLANGALGTLCKRGLGFLVQITNQLLKLWCPAMAAHGNYLEVSKLPMPGSHPQKT